MNHIKVNIPVNETDYKNGNGEGVWVLVDGFTEEDYNNDEAGTGRDGIPYEGILDNDSIYYPGLTHGTVVPLELRGGGRPVVQFDWLDANYD